MTQYDPGTATADSGRAIFKRGGCLFGFARRQLFARGNVFMGDG